MPLPRSQGWAYTLSHADREIPVADGDVVLGRSHTAGIRIDEETVSRSHALLSLREGRAVIRDLGSSNGLFLNGRRIVGQSPVSDGDTIGLGSAEVVLSIIPPADIDLRTAMIATIPAGAARSRPSETVTRFQNAPEREDPPGAAVPLDLPAERRPRRPRSADEVVIRDFGDEPEEMEARIAAFDQAPLAARFFSAVLDLFFAAGIAFVCFVPALIAIVTHGSLRDGAGSGRTFWILIGFCSVVALGAVAVYFLSGWAGRGATAGQRAAGVRLVAEDGRLVTGGRGLLRLAALVLYLATAGLLALTVLADPERRGLADKVSRSRVVAA